MKIASTKKEKPSSAKASPKTLPKSAMKRGHGRPSSKLRMVPVTTPTAKSESITFDQRMASVQKSGSPVRRKRHSANRTIVGNPIAKQTRGMCTTNERACIWRASRRWCGSAAANAAAAATNVDTRPPCAWDQLRRTASDVPRRRTRRSSGLE